MNALIVSQTASHVQMEAHAHYVSPLIICTKVNATVHAPSRLTLLVQIVSIAQVIVIHVWMETHAQFVALVITYTNKNVSVAVP